MTKIMTKVLLVVMVLNATLANFTFSVFAVNKPKAGEQLNFKWEKDNTLNDDLEFIGKRQGDVLLEWDMKEMGTYTLKYPIADNKSIEFEVKKTTDKEATVTYKVEGNNDVSKDKPLEIYKKNEGYIKANKDSFNGDFQLSNVYKNGDAKKVEFKIKKTSSSVGAAFKYNGNNIKFIWQDIKGQDGTNHNVMRFVTDGAKLGNIHPFELELTKNGSKISSNKDIFLGISGTTIKPFANAGNGHETGKEIIDQTTDRPIKEYPGQDDIGLNIQFDSPKVWEKATKKYIVEKPTPKETKVRFDFQIDSQNSFKVEIPNIYTNNNNNNNITIDGINTNGNHLLKVHSYEYKDGKCTLILKNNLKNKPQSPQEKPKPLEPSRIYDSVSVEATREKHSNFEFDSVKLPMGAAYTHLSYKVIARGEKEFYLEIDPFKGRNGFYTVLSGTSEGNLKKVATYEEKKNGETKILIPIDLTMSSQDKYFRVDFTFYPPQDGGKAITLKSQVLHYRPFKEDIRIGVPKSLEIVSANIVREEETQGVKKENLFLTIKWDVDYKSTIESIAKNYGKGNEKFNIDYLFYKGIKPDEIEIVDKVGKPADFIGVNLEFTNADDLSQVDYKLPKDKGIELIKGKTSIVGSKEIVTAEVTFKIPVGDKDTGKGVLLYPGTYFIANEGEYKITSTSTTKEKTGVSLPVTLTLDGVENIEVPSPQNLAIIEESVDNHNFSIKYDTMKYAEKGDLLYNYNEVMLKTIGRELKNESIKYDFYITQEKALFDELVKYHKDDEIPEDIKNKINKYDSKQPMEETGIDIDIKNTAGEKGNLLDTLRNKDILQISNVGQNIDIDKQIINFKGLDENETYYVVGRTIVVPYKKSDKSDMNDKPLEDKKDYSKFSKLVTATTINPQNPSENEKVPPAPTKFVAEDITLNSVDLVWDKVKDNLPPLEDGSTPKSTLEYQFIKTRGEQLPEAFLKSKDSYEKTWQGQYLKDVKNKYGLKTDKDKLYEFDGEKVQFSNTVADKERYEYINWEGAEGRIKDKTLSPNQIYFYYIRTVRIDEKNNEVYSVWVPLTFTTKNTTGPTNLRVEPKAEYDKKSEVVISFDIPKMDISLIGTEYDLQYSIKQDLGDWSEDKTMPKDKLSFKDNDDGKTMKVTYKITGLKSGAMYTIRVRMLNKPLDAPSMYSNEVEHRTDSDNTENDYDQDVENWENNFKDLIEDLKNQPYWFSKDTSSNTIVYYRPQYFDKIMATTNNSIIELSSGKGGSYKEYYLPASAVISAFDQNKGFKISYNGADVIFSAKTINPYNNDVIKKMAEEIESKGGNVEDYFVKLSVDFKNNKYIIDGSNSLSPSALITLSVVGTKDTILTLDQNMLNYIEELLQTKEFSKDVKNKIKELIKNKTDNKIMVQEIRKIVDSFKSKFGDELGKDLNSLSRKTSHIQYLIGDIIFTYTLPTDISIGGYKKSQGNWISVDVKDYLGKKAIYTKETGEYIFAGKKLVINGVGNLPNGNQITNIVVKYGLDDFLGKDNNINLRAPMTRRAIIGSLARIAGASKMQDPIEFFKTKNIVLSTRNMDNNITSEEAVYLIMKTYEMRSGKNLETTKIRNYNLTSNIKNINKNYKKPIQVAFETGIYNNPNMNAKGTIIVQEFLQSLVNMSTMLGI